MATEANAVAVVNGVACLTAPHALFGVMHMFLCDTVADRGADLLDPHCREGGGNVKGGVDVALKVSKGIGPSETGQAAVKSLSLDL